MSVLRKIGQGLKVLTYTLQVDFGFGPGQVPPLKGTAPADGQALTYEAASASATWTTPSASDPLALHTDGSRAMAATLDLGTHRIANVTDPANPQDAATKAYVDAHAGVTNPLAADLDAAGHKVTNLARVDLTYASSAQLGCFLSGATVIPWLALDFANTYVFGDSGAFNGGTRLLGNSVVYLAVSGTDEVTVTSARVTSAVPVRLPRYVVAALPAGAEGDTAYATNGRKPGEGAGVGTGVPVFYAAGGSGGAGWYSSCDGALVAA